MMADSVFVNRPELVPLSKLKIHPRIVKWAWAIKRRKEKISNNQTSFYLEVNPGSENSFEAARKEWSFCINVFWLVLSLIG